MKHIWTCVLLLSILKGFMCIESSHFVFYADIGETAVLPCIGNLHATSVLWRRNDILLSMGTTINDEVKEHKRLTITGNQLMGEYNLQLSNVSEKDFQTYTCEAAADGRTYQKEVVLAKVLNKLTTYIDDYTTTQSTFQSRIDFSWTSQSRRISSSCMKMIPIPVARPITLYIGKSPPPGSIYSSTICCRWHGIVICQQILIKCIATEQATVNLDDKIVRATSSIANSPEDTFLYYALYAVGVVSVLALIIACSMCIRYKYKPKKSELAISNEPMAVEQHDDQLNESSSQAYNEYESINDLYVMEKDSRMGHPIIKQNTRTNSSSSGSRESSYSGAPSENPYLVVVGEDSYSNIHPYQPLAEIPSIELQKYVTTMLDVNGDVYYSAITEKAHVDHTIAWNPRVPQRSMSYSDILSAADSIILHGKQQLKGNNCRLTW